MDAEFSTGDLPMADSGIGSTGHAGGVAERVKKKSARRFSRGLAINPLFCPEHVVDPFDTIEWDLRVAAIKGESGEVLFEQPDTSTELRQVARVPLGGRSPTVSPVAR